MTYTLTRSRRKTLAIHVKPDGTVEVRAPLRLAKSEIERFVAAKSAWIEKKQAEIAARQSELDAASRCPTSLYADGEFERVVRELVETWQQRLGVTVSFVGIRRMSSRWGSCTAALASSRAGQACGRIRLNAALEYCPRECLEYVIVHELAHLRESNHSPRFWAIVAGALPDYKARQVKLKALAWLLNAQEWNENEPRPE